MKSILKHSDKTAWHLPLSAAFPRKSIGAALSRFVDLVVIYSIEYRKAQVQARLYERLSLMSNAELATQGIRRDQIAQLIKDRLN